MKLFQNVIVEYIGQFSKFMGKKVDSARFISLLYLFELLNSNLTSFFKIWLEQRKQIQQIALFYFDYTHCAVYWIILPILFTF